MKDAKRPGQAVRLCRPSGTLTSVVDADGGCNNEHPPDQCNDAQQLCYPCQAPGPINVPLLKADTGLIRRQKEKGWKVRASSQYSS